MMFPPIDRFGLHLILVPANGSLLPDRCANRLMQTAEHISTHARFGFVAAHVRTDHMHVLVTATAEHDVSAFISELMDRLREIVRADMSTSTFSWDDAVHVTLLPPWHVEILASFVRDQDRYHATRSLENELDEVFRPNAVDDMSVH